MTEAWDHEAGSLSKEWRGQDTEGARAVACLPRIAAYIKRISLSL